MIEVTELQEWQKRRSKQRERFISAMDDDGQMKAAWRKELARHDEVVLKLARTFLAPDRNLDDFLDSGWAAARKRIVARSSMLPIKREEVSGWSLELFDQLRLYHGILIRDYIAWSEACHIAWGV